ncbi:NUDIX domain-containing protein [Schaalia canis]|uniref:NUDIX hydrolase n=1 Tax=Schaalia canis TaxID=100469 RepID=A0A3P1SH84_9ACTO|nr:NUDIX hydrolase [Schaalia canis]RRC96115.1 NUDIX hydrolase [Schaalia canis]
MPLKEIDPFIDGPLVDEPSTRRVHARTDIWQGRIVAVTAEEVEVVEGSAPVTREYIIHPGAVAVVALRGEPGAEEILLERQYRHPVRANLWEIPAGLLDVEGEDYLAAAQRELAEETDLQAATWHVLTDYFNSPGGCTESVRIFLARDITPTGEEFEREDEEVDMVAAWCPLDEAVAAVLEGRFHNPSAVAGILAVAAARARGWKDLRPADAPWMR